MSWRRVRTPVLGLAVLFTLAAAAPAAGDELVVRGKVAARDGARLEEGRVRLLALVDERQSVVLRAENRDLEPVAEAALRADGRFEIAAPRAGMWRLEAEAAGHLPMQVSLVPLVEETTLPELELRRREEVEVRVLDPDGQPLPGARVLATSTRRDFWFGSRFGDGRGGASPTARRATTDEAGIARLARAVDEELTLRAWAPGLVESAQLETRAATATLRLAAGRALTVRPVDGRRAPLAGVVARVGDGEWAVAADIDGRLRLTAPHGGELELRLSDPEKRYHVGQLAAPRDPGAAPLEVRLEEPRRIRGQVVDRDSRRPVAGALVWAASDPGDARRSDGRGAFTLDLGGDGTVSLLAAQPGYARAWQQLVERSPHDPVLALEPSARVRGVVVDTSGRPVAEAEIGVREDPGGGGMRMVFGDAGRDRARALSDGDGRFLLSGLDPQRSYRLTVRRDGYARSATELPELAPLATTDGVRVVLDAGSRLVGRVLDASGAPIAGARIEVETAAGGGAMRRFRDLQGDAGGGAEASSDNNGDFQVDHLEATAFDLEVSAAGFATATVPGLQVPAAGGTVDAGAIVLEPGVELAGRVLDEGGQPVEGAEVWARPPDPMNRMRLRFGGGGESEPQARSAGDGHFALSDRRRGERVDLVVRRSGYSATVLSGVEVPPVEPVEVVLQAASSLSGKVVDESGKPVPGARVQAYAEGGGAARGGAVFMMAMAGFARSGEDGEFTLEDIEPGTLRLSVSAEGFRETERSNIEVPVGKDVEDLEIELLTGASLAGRVRASDGRPVVGARVRVVEEQRGPGRFSFGSLTDGAGAYFLEGLEPGTRLIGASHDDEGEVTREIEIAEGDNSLDLVFAGGVEVGGRVVDEVGAALAGAVVHINASTRFFRGGAEERTAADGTFTFRGVRDGSYQVTAFKEGFAQPERGTSVEVAGAPVYGVEVRLAPGGVISGQIRGVDPGRLAAVDVWASSPPGRFANGEVRHDGTYRVADVGPGSWQVQAGLRDGGGLAEGRVTIDPGQAEAVLDLEFGAGLRVTGRVLLGVDPLPGLTVGLRGVDIGASASGVTARDGRFSIEGIEPGRYRLAVMDFASGLQHSEEHEIRSDVDLIVELRVSRVGGRVVDATDSSPVPGAVVRLEPLGEQDAWSRFFNRGGSTDSTGLFDVRNVSAGSYRLLVEKDGYSPGELSVQVSTDRSLEDLKVSLQPTEGLALRVRLPSGGAASRLSVAVLDAAGRVVVAGEHRADQEGKVRLTRVPAGSWTVLVGSQGAGVARLTAVSPGPPSDVRLPPEARLRVAIPELAEDRALVRVEALGADGQPAPRFSWSGQVERWWRASFGRATLGGLAPGPWRIRATAPDGRVWEDTVTLAPGDNPVLVLD